MVKLGKELLVKYKLRAFAFVKVSSKMLMKLAPGGKRESLQSGGIDVSKVLVATTTIS